MKQVKTLGWSYMCLLKENEAKLQALQAALIAGENSGPAKPFDSETFLRDMRRKHAAKA